MSAEGVLFVEGNGLDSGTQLLVAQCVTREDTAVAYADQCDMPAGGRLVEVEPNGSFNFEFQPTVFIGIDVREEVNCLTEACAIGIGIADGVGPQWYAAFTFPDDFPVPEAPTLAIQRSGFVDNEATAVVTGSGFQPASAIQLSQCPTGESERSVDAEDCLYDYGATATADEQGRIEVTMVLFETFQRSSGELIDCGTTPDRCVLADPFPQPGNRLSLTPFTE